MAKPVEQVDRVIIRFAGDSGDGMQLTGSRFTSETALLGNDLSTLPDFPAEIRAPAGSLPGRLGLPDPLLGPRHPHARRRAERPRRDEPGRAPDQPARPAQGRHADRQPRRLHRAQPREGRLHLEPARGRHPRRVPRPRRAADDDDDRGAQGDRRHQARGRALEEHVRAGPDVVALPPADRRARSPSSSASSPRSRRSPRRTSRRFKAGWAYGETSEDFAVTYEVAPAKMAPGTYRNITGNQALSLGLVAASVQSKLPLFLGAYPITPASGILEELARYKHFGVRTFQAEDEISAVGAALGAAFGGSLGVSTSSGPGVVLKAETIGLAIALELPLLILDIQRAGPSTGMPTKPEQADLLMVHVRPQLGVARAGDRRARRPAAASTRRSRRRGSRSSTARPSTCSPTPTSRTAPSRGCCRTSSRCPTSRPTFAEPEQHEGDFLPYKRDPDTLARPWAIPGTPGLEHRIGGLEKADGTGNVSYDPDNHDLMVRHARAQGRRDRGRHPRARGRRPRRRRPARARLGRDVRADHRRRPPAAPRGEEGRAGAPDLPEPVPAQHGRGAAPLPEGARSRRSTSASS